MASRSADGHSHITTTLARASIRQSRGPKQNPAGGNKTVAIATVHGSPPGFDLPRADVARRRRARVRARGGGEVGAGPSKEPLPPERSNGSNRKITAKLAQKPRKGDKSRGHASAHLLFARCLRNALSHDRLTALIVKGLRRLANMEGRAFNRRLRARNRTAFQDSGEKFSIT